MSSYRLKDETTQEAQVLHDSWAQSNPLQSPTVGSIVIQNVQAMWMRAIEARLQQVAYETGRVAVEINRLTELLGGIDTED